MCNTKQYPPVSNLQISLSPIDKSKISRHVPVVINLRLPVLSLTLFAHCYPSQTLLWLKIYQKLFSTHMHNWLLLYICRKNTYQSAVIRSISQCLAPKFASLSQPQKSEVVSEAVTPVQYPQVGNTKMDVHM